MELSAGRAGVHLHGDTLLIAALASQTLHLLRVEAGGTLAQLAALGQHLQPDDSAVLAAAAAAERAALVRLRVDEHCAHELAVAVAAGDAVVAAAAAAGATEAGTSSATCSGPCGGAGTCTQHGPAEARSAAAGPPQAEILAAPAADAAAAEHSEDCSDLSDEEEEGEDGPQAAITGLKQRLLAWLYMDARRRSSEPSAWTSAGGSSSSGGGGGGGGSALVAAAAVLPAVPGLSCSRRPLDRWHYNFESLSELTIGRAQLLDESRLLIQWVPPDLLFGPCEHCGHAAVRPMWLGSI